MAESARAAEARAPAGGPGDAPGEAWHRGAETKAKAPIELVFVKGGTFKLERGPEVTLSDFWLGKFEVTQAQWEAVMGWNPSTFRGPDRPVENVSWYDCQEFLRKLSARVGTEHRLPTEAEWEYAARSGGRQEKWAGTSREAEVGDFAWYHKNSGNQTHPVGLKKPNGLGFHDMNGNVWEWCQDWYAAYPSGPELDPTGPPNGAERVVRGGSWLVDTGLVRVSDRNRQPPDFRYFIQGFRVAASRAPAR